MPPKMLLERFGKDPAKMTDSKMAFLGRTIWIDTK